MCTLTDMFACWGRKMSPHLQKMLMISEQNFLLSNRKTAYKNSSTLVIDKVYEQVKKQNYGPILIRDSSNGDGRLKSTFDHSKRVDELYGGVPYYQLPIARISARWNNTIITMKKHDHSIICKLSSRDVGFLHAQKKTELAGEVTGQTSAKRALERGCHEYVRVVMKGIGPGRKSSINGLVLGGMHVVSISDITPLTMESLPQRPRKIRRI